MGIISIITPILNKNLMNISHAFVHFGEEEIESQKGNTACPRSPSQQVEVLYLNHKIGCQNPSFYLLPSMMLPWDFMQDLTCSVAAEDSWEMTHIHRYIRAYTHAYTVSEKHKALPSLRMGYCFYLYLRRTLNTFTVSLSCYNKTP